MQKAFAYARDFCIAEDEYLVTVSIVAELFDENSSPTHPQIKNLKNTMQIS